MTMRTIIPGDQNLLLLTALVTIAYQLLFFFIAATFKFDKVTDLAGGTNFVILSLMTFSLGAVDFPIISGQQYAMTVLVTLWGIRLSAFLFYRILMIAEDHRFDGMRDEPLKFIWFWVFQMMWCWLVSLPLIYINSTSFDDKELNYVDIIGIIVASIGLVVEAIADQQKYNFKQDSLNNGKWCDVGVWQYSRHPNYFGELIFWWGIFIGCSSAFTGSRTVGYYTIISPIFITALLFGLSGLPLLESGFNKRFGAKESFLRYRKVTSILIPLPQFVYKNTPSIIKSVFLFEWPIYADGLVSVHEVHEDAGVSELGHAKPLILAESPSKVPNDHDYNE
jgi:steroid 5-alpha reductase family enzyme